MKFNPLNHPILNRLPDTLDVSTPAWIEHIPIAFLLMDILKPRILVELGVHSGNSYNSFCQAVTALHLQTLCFGVDNWKGDAHAGFYDEEIYEKLSAYHSAKYGDFSKLIRKYFDDAIADFTNGSIDLLHIDGCHTYEAVKHDFQSWLPKLSDRAVVLFHDTTVYHKEFGVWKFWEEIKTTYPSFNFVHGHGLGCLAVGDHVPNALLQLFQDLNNDNQEFFHSLGNRIYEKFIKEGLAKEVDKTRNQLKQNAEKHSAYSNQLEDRIKTKEQLIERKEKQTEQQNNRIDELIKQGREANDRYASLVEELKKKQDEVLTLRSEMHTLQSELHSQKLDLKRKAEQLLERDKFIIERDQKLIKTREEKEGLVKEIGLEKEAIKQLQNQINALMVRCQTSETKITQLQIQDKEKEQIIARYKRELQYAQTDGKNKSKSILDLKRSVSFRIGWALTAPFRLIYNKFSSQNNSISFFIKAFGFGLLHPIAFLKHLNKRNFKTLRWALTSENPRFIYQNFKKLLSGENQNSFDSFNPSEHQLSKTQTQNKTVRVSQAQYESTSPSTSTTNANISDATKFNRNTRKGHSQELSETISNFDVLRFKGVRSKQANSPTILVCAHASGTRLYGAERSLIDVVEAFTEIHYNTVVVIPSTENSGYVNKLKSLSMEVLSFPYQWWRADSPIDESVVGVFEELIDRYKIDAVHVNTIMVCEPLIAGRRRNIPAVVHTREIINYDEALCDLIGANPDRIIEEVIANADYIIANSKSTAASFVEGRTVVLPNSIDIDEFNIKNDFNERRIFVGLISSNIEKKGIFDFVELAEKLKERASNLQFVLIGPKNELTSTIRHSQKSHGMYPNLSIAGYMKTPVDAISKVNIVVNLSHFQESFGRTVLEAMAANRPVIAYDWGALGELIAHERSGYLAPYKDIDQVAAYLERLAGTPSLITKMGQVGRMIAINRYAKRKFVESLRNIYTEILSTAKTTNFHLQRTTQKKLMVDVSVIIPNYNYEHYLVERIESIARQNVRPKEIIFLDDCSSDASMDVAENALNKTGIPFKIIQNSKNLGTYRQWQTGIFQATGKFVWIAEADDSAYPEFLETMLAFLEDPEVVIAYSQSERIDEQGQMLKPTNHHHTDDISESRWLDDYKEIGVREVVDALIYRNTIPNVSACVFRRNTLDDALLGVENCQYCGDWFIYSNLLMMGSVAYCARPLNKYRRHSGSVTRQNIRSIEYLNEVLSIRESLIRQFPVHKTQLPRIVELTDKDYKIDGLSRNSEAPSFLHFMKVAENWAQSRRRITFITTNNGSYTGGSEVLWRDAALRLRAEGHDVTVVIKKWDPEPPFAIIFRRAGIKMFFKGEDEIHSVYSFHPDLVVISTGDQDEGIEYFGALRAQGIKYVIINQLTKQPEYWPIRKNKIDAVRDGYLGSAKAFFVSWNNHRVMEERLNVKIPNASLAYNPLDVPREIDLPYPSMENGIQLALPARLLKIHKGQHLAIEVISKSKWRKRKIILNLYGEGPDKQELEEQVKNFGLTNVKFHPRMPDMTDIWRANHGILMPSFMEGLPIVLTGAMMSKRVPIVTDIGGHREVILDNVSGFIAKLPTVEDMDEAMERAYQRIDEWEEIGHRARQAILEYLPDDNVGYFVSKINEVVDVNNKKMQTV